MPHNVFCYINGVITYSVILYFMSGTYEAKCVWANGNQSTVTFLEIKDSR